MRKLLGGALLVIGVGLLGWYGKSNNAVTMQTEVTEGALAAASGTVHPISTTVSGRDITITGIADGEAERDQIVASMNEVTGRRVVNDELRVLETGSPFVLDAVKTSDGISYSGMVPTETDRSSLAARIGSAADDLELMAGSPGSEWISVVGQGLDGLYNLQDGAMGISDRSVVISGSALTPTEDAAARAALDGLPAGYEANFDITVLDDGTPLRLTLDVTEDGDLTSSGKVPSSFDMEQLSASLAKDVETGIERGVLPSAVEGWDVAAQSGAQALAKLNYGRVEMTEDSLTISGAATPDGKAEAEALIAALPEGVTGTALIDLYDDGAPFSLEMTKSDAAMSASGKFPADLATSDVVGDVPADGIRNAFIVDETGGFAIAATNGVQALSTLEEGMLSVVGTDITLSGVAMTPNEADTAKSQFDGVPDGYTTSFDISTIDDGTPPNFNVSYDAGGGATVSGKLPAGFEVSDVAAALQLANVSGDPVQGLIGDGTQAKTQLSALVGWLPEIEQLNFNSDDDAVTVTALAAPGVDQSLVEAGLAEALGNDASVTVTEATELPDEGTTRTNQATGQQEAFTSGYWLPVLDFVSDLDTCNRLSAEALQVSKINFVTGSAQLDAQSIRAINAVAAIIRKCVESTDLNVEIGGHTDSQGGEDLNQQLSQSRAEAVRVALLARSVDEARITAVGYGEAEPIADNNTEEGRAANRRTIITWFEPAAPEPEVEVEAADEAGSATDDTGSDATIDTENNTSVGE